MSNRPNTSRPTTHPNITMFSLLLLFSLLPLTFSLCSQPYGATTFSGPPVVNKVEGREFSVSWVDLVENGECATGFYVEWRNSSKPRDKRTTGELDKTRTETRIVVDGDPSRDDFFFQVFAFKKTNNQIVDKVISIEIMVPARQTSPNFPSVTEPQFTKIPSVEQGKGQVKISWQGIITNSRAATSYLVRWKTDSQTVFKRSNPLHTEEFWVPGMAIGQTYVFQVVAIVQYTYERQTVEKWIKSPLATFTTTASISGQDQGETVSGSSGMVSLPMETRPKRVPTHLQDQCGDPKYAVRYLRKKGCLKNDSTTVDLNFVFGDGDSIFITIFASLFCVIGGVLNTIVLIAVLNYRITRRHVTTPFILSTVVSDLIYSVVILPIMAMRFYRKESPLNEKLCHMYPVLYYTVQGASLFSLTMVTLNRAAMLFIPSMVDKLFTNTKLIRGKHFPLNSFIILLVCWLIPLIGLFPTILGKNGCLGLNYITQSCTILHDSKGHSPKSMMYSIVVAIPTITIIVTDIAIYFKMRSIQKADVRMSVTVVDERKMEKKFMMMLATILFIFFLTYMPGFVIKSLDSCYGWPTTHAVAYVFNWASVWLNPIVYVVGQKKYQDALRHLFGRFDLQRRNTKQFIPSINLSGTGGTGGDQKGASSAEVVVGEDNREQSLLSKYMARVKERVSFGNTDSTTDGSK